MKDSIRNAYRVDVIIPVFNGERHILRAIRSARNQTKPPGQIIVVDDGSQDKTVKLLEDFIRVSNFPISLIKLKENHGPSFARNIGFNSSKSDFVIFLDSDDELYPDMIENLLSSYHQRAQKDAGLVYGKAEFYDEKRQVVDFVKTKSQSSVSVLIGKPNLETLLRDITGISMGCYMIKSDVFRVVGKFDTNLRINEDWDLYLRLTEVGFSFDYCDKTLCRINSHNDNTTKNISGNFYGIVPFVNKWINVIKNCGLKRDYYKELMCYSILKKLPNVKPYVFLRSHVSRRNLGVIFGDCPFSLEVEILKKAVYFANRKFFHLKVNSEMISS
jgi:glycosyltransferase involved in cell wall biosynthesis